MVDCIFSSSWLNFFTISYGWDVISGNRLKSAFFEGGWVTLSADFRGKGASKYLADMYCCRLGLLKCDALINCHHLQAFMLSFLNSVLTEYSQCTKVYVCDENSKNCKCYKKTQMDNLWLRKRWEHERATLTTTQRPDCLVRPHPQQLPRPPAPSAVEQISLSKPDPSLQSAVTKPSQRQAFGEQFKPLSYSPAQSKPESARTAPQSLAQK